MALEFPRPSNVELTGISRQSTSTGKDIILGVNSSNWVDGHCIKRDWNVTGDAIPYLEMADRFSISNMVIEQVQKMEYSVWMR